MTFRICTMSEQSDSVICILSEKQRKCNPETDSGRVTVPEVHGWPENIIVQRINRT